MSDLIDRQAAIETVRKCAVKEVTPAYMLIDKAEAMTELMKNAYKRVYWWMYKEYALPEPYKGVTE